MSISFYLVQFVGSNSKLCARLQFSRRLQRTGSHAALCSNRRSSPAPSTHLNMESFRRKIYWKFPRVTEANLRASERVKKGPVRKNSGVLEWRDSTLCSPSVSTTDRTLPFVLLTYTKASPFRFRSHDQSGCCVTLRAEEVERRFQRLIVRDRICCQPVATRRHI